MMEPQQLPVADGAVAGEAVQGTTVEDNVMDNGGVEQTEQTEEQRLWAAVRENPSDFQSWSYLVQLVDGKGEIEGIRSVYDAFLSEFPLCYVYWKRYADHEAATGATQDKVTEIYERALEAFPHSVDLWTYYCTFLAEKLADPAPVRSAFERAIDKVGTDYLAQSLWDKYLEYELSHKEFANVTRLYSRVLAVPLEALSKYYERWKVHASAYSVNDILPAEEKEQFAAEETDEAKRARAMAAREEVYQVTQQELAKIQPFENALRERPYFHVKPVPEEMLDTWHRYLTFQEAEGTAAKTLKLYERCLVPCCYYMAFWRRYARFVEETSGAEDAARVWERATDKLLKRRPEPFLEFAFFRESHGQIDAARELYQHVLSFAAGHVEATLRHAQLEHRQRNLDAANSILEAARENAKTEAVGVFLAIYHATFVNRSMRDATRARDIYHRALARYSSNKSLWLAAIELETSLACGGLTATPEEAVEAFERVVALCQRAIDPSSLLSEDARVELWQHYLDLVHSFAPTVDFVNQATRAFLAAYPSGKVKSKKRRHDEDVEAANKKTARASVLPTPGAGVTAAHLPAAAAAAYPAAMGYNAYSAYGGAYGAYGTPQQAGAYGAAWPQQPQAAYGAAAQPAYPGYSGYAGY